MNSKFEQHLNAAKQEVQKIGADKKINGNDLTHLQELDAKMSALEAHKNSLEYKAFKEDLQKLSDKMLANGYTVNNENDYLVLKNIIQHSTSSGIELPSKEEIPYKTFAIAINTEGEVVVYGEKRTIKRRGYIRNGTFEKDIAQMSDMDYKSNNNNFNVNLATGNYGIETKTYGGLQQTENINNNDSQVSGEQKLTPVGGQLKAEDTEKATKDIPEQKETKNTDIEKIKNMDKAAILEKLGQLSAHEKHFSSIRKNKEHIALIQRVAEIYNVPRVRSYVNKNNFVDGIYGEGTRQAVREVQEKLGNLYTDSIDGWAGTNTIDAVIQKGNS